RSQRRRAEGGSGGSGRPRGSADAAARESRALRPRPAEEGAGDEREKDVVVVGAGIAGLTAAWQLRDLDTLVLETDDRVGGRIKSVARGSHWVSVGAHMFPGEGSLLWGLLEELALEPVRIRGSLLGIAQRGKVVTGGRGGLHGRPLRARLGGRRRRARLQPPQRAVLAAGGAGAAARGACRDGRAGHPGGP